MPARFPFAQLIVRPPAAAATNQHEPSDDASVSSTLTVERINNAKLPAAADSPAAPQSPSDTTRRVRFNLNDNVEYENKSLCQEDCASLWYDAADFACFKENLSCFAKHVARSEQRCAASQTSYSAVLRSTYLACCEAGTTDDVLTELQQEELRQWLSITLSRHGAERNCVKYLRRQRRERRSEIVALVLELQADQQEHECQLDEEELRACCETFSLPSRHFARIMAAAGAAATASATTHQ